MLRKSRPSIQTREQVNTKRHVKSFPPYHHAKRFPLDRGVLNNGASSGSARRLLNLRNARHFATFTQMPVVPAAARDWQHLFHVLTGILVALASRHDNLRMFWHPLFRQHSCNGKLGRGANGWIG